MMHASSFLLPLHLPAIIKTERNSSRKEKEEGANKNLVTGCPKSQECKKSFPDPCLSGTKRTRKQVFLPSALKSLQLSFMHEIPLGIILA